MPLVIADTDANGNAGIICGKYCHPSALNCHPFPRTVELCVDVVNTVYEEGGLPLEVDPTTLCPVFTGDCLLGPCDPYGEIMVPVPSISFGLRYPPVDPAPAPYVPDTDETPLLVIYENGVEVADGWSAPPDTPCIWLRLYGR